MRNNKNNITSSVRNITLKLKNITSHFTGKEKIITLVSTIIILSFVNIINTSALSYQGSAEIKFTFNPTLSINISPSDLVIQNLTPGTMNTSNEIAITVSTNNVYGYNLYATVGNSVQNNTNLTRNSSNDVFNSISASAGLSSLDTNNTWGYTYSLDSGTTWSNYNGLPLYSAAGARLKRTNEPSEDTVNFKIAAKSSTTQPSGNYSNVINFTAVAKLAPFSLSESYEAYYTKTGKTKLDGYYVMQDMNEEICDNAEIMESELQVIDSRDRKVYWIAKLKDGHCWMTQNLDLDLDSNKTYTHSNTDLGWEKSNVDENASWQPSKSTSNSIEDWALTYNTPESYDSGDVYYYSSGSKAQDIEYQSLGDCMTGGHTIDDCRHYSAGNYYNWTAAIAMNNSKSIKPGLAETSICPAGWQLPVGSTFNSLFYQYDVITASGATVSNNYTADGFNKIRAIPLYFVRAGSISRSGGVYILDSIGVNGRFWGKEVFTYSMAGLLDFNSSYARTTSFTRDYGFFVRCLAR